MGFFETAGIALEPLSAASIFVDLNQIRFPKELAPKGPLQGGKFIALQHAHIIIRLLVQVAPPHLQNELMVGVQFEGLWG